MEIILNPLPLIEAVGLIGVFAIVFMESGIFFGFFFPGDSLLFVAGLLSSQGFFSFSLLVVGCAAASFFGSIAGYVFGGSVGSKLFSREDSVFFHKKHLESARDYFGRYGKKTILISRFIPVVRTFVPIFAGIGKMNLKVFILYNLIGAAAWSILLCGLGFYLGNMIDDIDRYVLPIVLFIIVLSFLPSIAKFFRKKPSTS